MRPPPATPSSATPTSGSSCSMLWVQRLIPRVPPRLLGPLIRLMASKRFVDWSFNHYMRVAPPEFAGSPRPGLLLESSLP